MSDPSILDDNDPDVKDPDFVLQNLDICNEDRIYNNPPFTIRSKQRLAEIVASQVCFYVMCALKAFIGSEMAPSIVIIGTGTIGSAIIEALYGCGCQPYMYIYARSDVAAKTWRDMGFKSNHNIHRLLRGVNADILLFNFNLQSFPAVCRQIIEVVTPQTVAISSIFGLQRKRVARVLRVNTVFRTYVEPLKIKKRLEHELSDIIAMQRDMVKSSGVAELLFGAFGESKPTTAHDGNAAAGKAGPFNSAIRRMDSGSDSDEDTERHAARMALEAEYGTPMTPLEEATELVAKCSKNAIYDLIMLLEQFFSIRGMPFTLARREAMESILGDVVYNSENSFSNNFNGDEDPSNANFFFGAPMPQLNPHVVPNEENSGSCHSSPQTRRQSAHRRGILKSKAPSPPKPDTYATMKSKVARNSPTSSPKTSKYRTNKTSALLNLHFPLTSVILNIQRKFGVHFQVKFSQYMRIIDMPPPVVERTSSTAQEWPPEPVYFDNILDAYADRRMMHESLHSEEFIIGLYDMDTVHQNPKTKGFKLLKKMEQDSDEDSEDSLSIHHSTKVVESDKESMGGLSMEEVASINNLSAQTSRLLSGDVDALLDQDM